MELLSQAAAGCAWIAHRGGIHGNLKMQNILFSKVQEVERNVKYVAKVSDYGLACMSPEALSGAACP
eukprot:4509935-Amphidinium_carterae.1